MFYLRWWNNGTLRARLCFWMSPALPASRAAACTKWSLADVQRGSCKKQGPSTSTSVSRSSAEPAWRSLRAIATTPSGRSVFVSFVTIKHQCVCASSLSDFELARHSYTNTNIKEVQKKLATTVFTLATWSFLKHIEYKKSTRESKCNDKDTAIMLVTSAVSH